MTRRTMSVQEVATRLNVSQGTIRHWIVVGRLSATKVGRSYVISEEEMSRMLVTEERPTKDMKKPDRNRKQRVAALQGSLIGTGLTLKSVDDYRQKELERLRNQAGHCAR